MVDQTGEYTGELIFDGRGVTRVLGTSYDSPQDEQPGRPVSAPPRQLATLNSGWALSDAFDDASPSDFEGLSRGALLRALRAVRDVLVNEGFAGLDIERVIARSRFTPAEARALRASFPAAEELVVVLLRRIHLPLFEDLSNAALTSEPVLDTMLALVQRYVARVRRDLPLYQRYVAIFTNIIEPLSVPARVLIALDEINRQSIQIVAALLAEGQMRDEVRSGDPEVLARSLVMCVNGLIHGVSNPTRLMAAGIHTDDLIDRALAILIDGLAARTERP